jgi:hypothetical protein
MKASMIIPKLFETAEDARIETAGGFDPPAA